MITSADRVLLDRLAAGTSGAPADALDALWERVGGLLEATAAALPAPASFQTELWPWLDPQDPRVGYPFLWGRIKARDRTDYAAHMGLFISATSANFCVDLEKDLLDAGVSRESLADVHGFYAGRGRAVLSSLDRQSTPGGLAGPAEHDTPEEVLPAIWTDRGNVRRVADFLDGDFNAFMSANNDHGHPWPKVGYLFDPIANVSVRDAVELLPRLVKWAKTLLPIYSGLVDLDNTVSNSDMTARSPAS